MNKAKLHDHSRKYARRNGTPSKHRPNKNQESNHGKPEVMDIRPGCREPSRTSHGSACDSCFSVGPDTPSGPFELSWVS